MFNSKEEALEWINFILDKHAARYSTLFPNIERENPNGGHFFKVSLISKNIIIDAVYGKGEIDKGGLKIGGERRWQYIMPFNNLKKITLVFHDVLPQVEIKLHAKWFKHFTKKNLNELNKLNPLYSKESYVNILLSDKVIQDDNFNEYKLKEAFKLFAAL